MSENRKIDYMICPDDAGDSIPTVESVKFTIKTSQTKSSAEQITDLRRRTGMSRKAFCDYLGIPYRTVTEWERGGRTMPDYVLRLIEYQLKAEKMLKD